MSSNVNYSFVNKSDSDSTIVFRSSVESFGLDHVTDKDITSFYHSFSNYLHFDTGLLPVDGSGVLSIRTAGPFTQVAYQHKPGMYYINWGDYEGDDSAVKYYVAQPYRIVIGDFFNGNIYGARTFYSPVPINYPSAPLYHVNLPNINCNGYRGNGVGWICLYHTEDVSSYPFSEKVVKLIDRCSGTEAYNDQNMNETDGPRFYQKRNKPGHTWDPSLWQSYSQDNGYEWTLDPDLWIPVLVQDLDHQDRHYDDGEPLTFVKALLGNYQSYYTDTVIPKPYNSISRSDLNLDPSQITSWFKQSYNSSSISFDNKDIYQNIESVRENISTTAQKSFDEEEEETILCDSCGTDCYSDGYTSIYRYSHQTNQISPVACYCTDCTGDYSVYVEHLNEHFQEDDSDVVYSELLESYFHTSLWKQFVTCSGCSAQHPYDTSSAIYEHHLPIWNSTSEDGHTICSNCMPYSYNDDNIHSRIKCHSHSCYQEILNPQLYSNDYLINSLHNPFTDQTSYYCNYCYYSSDPFSIIFPNNNDDFETVSSLNAKCVCGKLDSYDNFFPFYFNFPILQDSLDPVSDSVILSDYVKNHKYCKHSPHQHSSMHHFAYSLKINHICSSCKDVVSSSDFHAKTEYLNNISHNLSNIIKSSVGSNQKLDDIYGLCFELGSPLSEKYNVFYTEFIDSITPF